MRIVRAESVSAIYLVDATSAGVTSGQARDPIMATVDRGRSAELDTVSTTRGAALLALGRAQVFLITSYQNIRQCERDKPLDLRDYPKLANQAFPWGMSERAYVKVNLYYMTVW